MNPKKDYFCIVFAEIAQSVERFTRNEKVAGSIPAFGSTNRHLAVPPYGKCEMLFLFLTEKIVSTPEKPSFI